jgi:hypothetical protein
MKKLLVALALMGLATQASAAITYVTEDGMVLDFHGKLRQYIETDHVTGPGSNTTTSSDNDRNPGVKYTTYISKVGFGLMQPLNDMSPGLKFNALFDTYIYPDSPTIGTTNTGASNRSIQIGNDRATVGFTKDGVFDLDFGRKAHQVWIAQATHGSAITSGISDQEGSFMGEIHARQKLRFSNGIYGKLWVYDGFYVATDYQLAEAANVQDAYTVGLGYKKGPVDLKALYLDYQDGHYKSTALAAAYTFENGIRVAGIASDDYYQIGNPNNTTLADQHTQGYSGVVTFPIAPKWTGEVSAGHRADSATTDSVNALGAGIRYSATKHITFIGQTNWTKVEGDRPIFFTVPNNFAGVYGTERTNVAVGMEIKF